MTTGVKAEVALIKKFADGRTSEARALKRKIELLIEEAGGREKLNYEQDELLDLIRVQLIKMIHFGEWLGNQSNLVNHLGDVPKVSDAYDKAQNHYIKLATKFRSLIPQENPSDALEDF